MEINEERNYEDRFTGKIEVTYFADDLEEAREELRRLLTILFEDDNVIQVYGDVIKNAETIAT